MQLSHSQTHTLAGHLRAQEGFGKDFKVPEAKILRHSEPAQLQLAMFQPLSRKVLAFEYEPIKCSFYERTLELLKTYTKRPLSRKDCSLEALGM